MSWQENRRRKRTWYLHYKRLADQLAALCAVHSAGPAPTVPAAAVLEMFFELYEFHYMHRKRSVAMSAHESMLLAIQDSGLAGISLFPVRTTTPALAPAAPAAEEELVPGSATVIHLVPGDWVIQELP